MPGLNALIKLLRGGKEEARLSQELAERLAATRQYQLAEPMLTNEAGRPVGNKLPAPVAEAIQQTPIVVRRHNIDDLLKNERLDTVHEKAGRSSAKVKSSRNKVEQALFGDKGQVYGSFSSDVLDEARRPFDLTRDGTDLLVPRGTLAEYGSIALGLKPSVRSHATMTFGDSAIATRLDMTPKELLTSYASPVAKGSELDALLQEYRSVPFKQRKAYEKAKREYEAALIERYGLTDKDLLSAVLPRPVGNPGLLPLLSTEKDLMGSAADALNELGGRRWLKKGYTEEEIPRASNYFEVQLHKPITPDDIETVYDLGFRPSSELRKNVESLGLKYQVRPSGIYDELEQAGMPKTVGELMRAALDAGYEIPKEFKRIVDSPSQDFWGYLDRPVKFGTKGYADGGLVGGNDLTRPYIGYRSAGRRPERNNDREASSLAPLAALRGFASGVLGAPGDLEALVRMLPGLSEQTVLPTSEDVERRLPLRSVSESPIGRAATGAGQIGGGFYLGPGSPLRVIGAIPGAVKHGATEFVKASGVPSSNVIKNKGGNWLEGEIETFLTPLRAGREEQERAYRNFLLDADKQDAFSAWLKERLAADPAFQRRNAFDVANEFLTGRGDAPLSIGPADTAVNRWLDTKLNKYIRNEMGTPEDPIRDLIAKGTTHIPENDLLREGAWVSDFVAGQRVKQGFPEEGFAKAIHAERGFPEGREGDLARMAESWENMADSTFNINDAVELITTHGASAPWLNKLPPRTPVYSMPDVRHMHPAELGFDRLAETLRAAVTPGSTFPDALRLTPDKLDKVSVPQAVELSAKYDKWFADQRAAELAARSRNAATHVVKEYPETGLQWIEIKAPELGADKLTQLPEGWRILKNGGKGDEYYYVVDANGRPLPGAGTVGATPEEALDKGLSYLNKQQGRKPLQDALEHEGEAMSHCVGDYCDEVFAGHRRIFSLREKNGKSVATIEVKPRVPEGERAVDRRQLLPEVYARRYGDDSDLGLSIVQIKGPANRAPKEEYLPAIHDFIFTGNFTDVGDAANAGLRRFNNVFNSAELNKLREIGAELPSHGWLSGPEIQRLQDLITPEGKRLYYDIRGNIIDSDLDRAARPGFAAGGLVGYDDDKIQSLANALREELYA